MGDYRLNKFFRIFWKKVLKTKLTSIDAASLYLAAWLCSVGRDSWTGCSRQAHGGLTHIGGQRWRAVRLSPAKIKHLHSTLSKYIFYVPVAYILYLRNPRVYSNSPSILGCFTDSVRFLDFFLRDIIFCGMLYFHNIPLIFITSRSI
jgi:hypothetical protein